MSRAPEGASTCTEVLRRRAGLTPDRRAFLYLPDGETEGEQLTYAALDARARGIAAALQAAVGPGERVLLCFSPGLEFVAGFFGCLYAGVVAVPIDLPENPEAARRVAAIAADAGVALVLSTHATGPTLARFPALADLPHLALDAPGDPDAWRDPGVAPDGLAFLQYTSGSTAAPKGVMITHANILANQRAIAAAAGQTGDSVFLSWLPLFHDMGLMGMVVQPIYVGAPCILMPPRAFLARPRRWLQAITTYGATISGGPDFAFALCEARIAPAERAGLDLSTWAVAYSGSEPVSGATLDRFAEAFTPVGLAAHALYPCYGLAEATAFYTGGAPGAAPVRLAVASEALARHEVAIVAAAAPTDPGVAPATPAATPSPDALPAHPFVACGHPHAGHALRLVDPATRRPAAPDAVGEIWLAGPSVAAGYWGRPEATAETFQAFTEAGEGPYLRTGDLGFLHAGDVVVCGRLKDLVIVRGRNHHPHDLEHTVRGSHPALAGGDGAAFTVPGSGEERLVVVHEIRPAHQDDPGMFDAVRQAVASVHGLEVHAVVFIKRGALPKTSSGKVRRGACRDAYLADALDALALEIRVPVRAAARAPETEDERRLAALWATILGRADLGRDADFFALGGDSIAAMRLVAAVEDGWGVAISLATLAAAPTLGALAAAIAAAAPAEPWPTLVPAPEARHAPFGLNGIQLAYWLGRDAAVGLGGVATHAYLELALPAFDPARLGAALDRLVARHPALRTVILPGERQQVLAVVPAYQVATHVAADEATLEDAVAATRATMSHQVLPGDRWPLFDVRATCLPDGRARLHVSVDLLVADAWSLRLAARELAALYADPDAALPPLGLDFQDYVAAEAALAGSPRHARALAYWRDRLPTLPPAPELPTALTRPADLAGAAGIDAPTFVRRQTVLPPDVWRALKRRAAAYGLTPTGVLLAAYAEVIGAWNRGRDFTLNVTLFQRLPLHPDVDRLLGDFTSLTLLAVEAPADGPFGPRARRLAARLWQDLDHRLVSGLALMRELARDLDRPTVAMPVVFTSTLVDGDADAEGALPPGVAVLHAVSQTPQVLLDHQVHQLAGALHASWDALEAHFPPGVVEAMVAAHGALLHRLAADDAAWATPPADLVPVDQARAFAAANATDAPIAPVLLHERFLARRAEAPGALAVVAGAHRWTYEEVGRFADALAWRLLAHDASPGRLVAVVMEKGWEQVVAVLGVLGAGAAYVPIDPASPRERLHHLLAHAEATLVVTTPGIDAALAWPAGVTRLVVTAADLPAEAPPAPPRVAVPTDLAYVIYTSGSTGLPKGVMIDHRGAVNTIDDVNRRFGVGPADRVLALSSLGFDLSVYDVFGLLGAGGAVVLPSPAAARDPGRWLALLADEAVTVWNTVPALMELLVEHAEDMGCDLPASLRLAMLSGDWIPLALPGRLAARAPEVRLVSLGGATEASIWSNFHPVEGLDPAWRSVPYGRPLANQRFHILGDGGRPVPAWVPGQLHIAGTGLALGYWRDPGRTAAGFVAHPGTGERLYRTGDLGRYWPDGTIEFLGREDHQVKVGGHRIELGEVEAAFLAHPDVRAVVVAPDGPARGARRLLAYVVPEDPARPPGAEALRAFVAGKLPAYMVPARVLPLAAVPLGLNGKVDRRLLPAPDAVAGADDAPVTPAERLIAGLWCEVLGVERVGRHDQFFALGGDSLAALRFLARLRAQHGRELSFGSLFAAPSLAELAQALEAAPAPAEIRPLVTDGPLPLSFAQERLWFLDRLAPGNAAYHVPLALRIEGPLDVARLSASLDAVLARHEGLRAAFVEEDGQPGVRLAPGVSAPIAIEDVTEASLPGRLRTEAGRPFALDRPPLLRARLFRLAPDTHVFTLTLHHLICDGWSLGLLMQELGAGYAGEAAAPAPGIRYADYAHWERTALVGDRLDAPLAYWRERLAGRLPILALPTDRPRPATPSGAGANATFFLPADLTTRLEAVGRAEGATLFMVLLAGFKAWLHRLTGQTDVLVAAAAANRRHPETEALIGLFVDTLALRTDLSGDPAFGTLLGRVREVVTGAQAHQEVPLQALVTALAPTRDAGGVPVVRVGFGMQAAPMPTLDIAGLSLTPVPIDTGAARADFTLLFWKEAGGLRGVAEYRTDLFEGDTIARWLEAYAAVLAAGAASPASPLSALGGEAARTAGTGADGHGHGSSPLAPPTTDDKQAYLAPRTPTETALVALWEVLFDHRPLGVRDDFFALGGHSLLAVRLMARVRRAFGREVALGLLFGEATIEALAAAIDAGDGADGDVLVSLADGPGPAVFLVHPVGGGVACYRDLARALPGRRVLGLQAPGLAGLAAPHTVADLAAMYVARLRAVQPDGPYHLAGWSLGGVVAHEMARQLGLAGAFVGALVLIDGHLAPPEPATDPDDATLLRRFAEDAAALAGRPVSAALAAAADGGPSDAWLALAVAEGLVPAGFDGDALRALWSTFATNARAGLAHRAGRFVGDATFIAAAEGPTAGLAAEAGWAAHIGGHLNAVTLPGDHYSLMGPSLAAAAARIVADAAAAAEAAWTDPLAASRFGAPAAVPASQDAPVRRAEEGPVC